MQMCQLDSWVPMSASMGSVYHLHGLPPNYYHTSNLLNRKICSRFLCSKWIFRCVPIGQKNPVGWHGMNPPGWRVSRDSRRCGLQQQCSTVGRDAQFCSIGIPLWSSKLWFLEASVTYGSLMCLECSGQHRSLGAGNLWGLVSRCFGHHTEIGELETRWSNCGAWDGGNFASKKLVFLWSFFWLIPLMLWRWHCTSVYKEVDVGLGWNSFNWSDKFLVGEIQRDERDDQSFLFVCAIPETLNRCLLSPTGLCLLLDVFAHTKILPTMCYKLEWWPYGTSSI